jgi:8-oxo-dGTP pyrophosphatase MutT (NUDIX family)
MSKDFSLDETLKKVSALNLDYSGAELRLRILGATVDHPPRGRAAVCVLFSGNDFENAKVLLTERSMTVATHAGQVAFPGGGFEEEDRNDPVLTAFRECEEEVGISRILPRAIGLLPVFPTMTGNFEVHPVIAALDPNQAIPALTFMPSEVSSGEWVSVQALRATRQYEERTVSGITLQMPFFMWGERKMWGISAWIFDLILNRYDTIKG